MEITVNSIPIDCILCIRKNADIIVLRMQKSKRCRNYVCQAASKTSVNSTVTRSKKIINANVFDNAVKKDNGNLSSEDDSYFSNTDEE